MACSSDYSNRWWRHSTNIYFVVYTWIFKSHEVRICTRPWYLRNGARPAQHGERNFVAQATSPEVYSTLKPRLMLPPFGKTRNDSRQSQKPSIHKKEKPCRPCKCSFDRYWSVNSNNSPFQCVIAACAMSLLVWGENPRRRKQAPLSRNEDEVIDIYLQFITTSILSSL